MLNDADCSMDDGIPADALELECRKGAAIAEDPRGAIRSERKCRR